MATTTASSGSCPSEDDAGCSADAFEERAANSARAPESIVVALAMRVCKEA
jgi:hypothetical protein